MFGAQGDGVKWRQASLRRPTAALRALLVLGLGATGAASAACAPKDFNGAKFTVCTFDPRHDDIRLFLSGPDDKPYGSLGALASALKQKGEKLGDYCARNPTHSLLTAAEEVMEK